MIKKGLKGDCQINTRQTIAEQITFSRLKPFMTANIHEVAPLSMTKTTVVLHASRIIFLMIFCLNTLNVQANHFPGIQIDCLLQKKDSVVKHSPKKASIYSAILPGLGQAYNRKYWKMPVVYAAIGISGYYLLNNRNEMRSRQQELIVRLDNDPSTVPSPSFANKSTDVLKSERNYYRKMRDYSILATAAFYVLNIVDAAVDAHFYNFDINKPLASQTQRHLHLYAGQSNGVIGYGVAWRF